MKLFKDHLLLTNMSFRGTIIILYTFTYGSIYNMTLPLEEEMKLSHEIQGQKEIDKLPLPSCRFFIQAFLGDNLDIFFYFWFKYNSDRSTTHSKFDPTGVRTHDLHHEQ